MKKRWIGLGAMVCVMGSASLAMAQDAAEGETNSKFYDFDGVTIDGEFKKPEIMKDKARDKAEFKRLLNLKKRFLPKVLESSEEQALR